MRAWALTGLVLWFFLAPLCGLAQELKGYQAEVSQEITDKDVVYARNLAFGKLRELVVQAAVLELLGEGMYNEFRADDSFGRRLDSSRYLASVKVLKEERQANLFLMRIEGLVDVTSLTDRLQEMNLILKGDPWVKVSLWVEGGLQLPKEALLERLKLFHLTVVSTESLKLDKSLDKSQPSFAQSLFPERGTAEVALLVEPKKATQGELYGGVGLRVFRKAGLSSLGSFSMSLEPFSEGQLPQALAGRDKSFLALFSLSSLALPAFREGESSSLEMEVQGLRSPELQSQFETHVLKPNPSVAGFWLKELSQNKAVYQVQAKQELPVLLENLKKANPYFYFEVVKFEVNQLVLKAEYKLGRQVVPVKPMNLDPKLMTEIAQMLDLDPKATPPSDWLPTVGEVEPNNNSLALNQLPTKVLVYGQISSRADEDLFEIEPVAGMKTLTLEWAKVGKTDLSPQIKLYDENLGYLNQYNLLGTKHTKIPISLPEVPHGPLYLRIGDRVGFIQGETGGFKSYKYLIRITWK